VTPHPPLTGLVPAVLTPFDRDGELNLAAVERQAELALRDGLTAVFVGGTTGESASMTVAERQALARRWAEVARGTPLRLVVHVGANCLADARALAAQAEQLGAVAVSAVAPSYFKPKTPALLAESCAAIASAAPDTPFYYYDIPGMTGLTLPVVESVRTIAERVPTFAGVKFSNPDLTTFQHLMRLDGGRLGLLWGTDEYLLAAVALGVEGAVGSTYNFAAPLFRRMLAAFRAGDLAAARAEQYRAVELITLLARYGYFAAAKEVVRLRGVDLGPVRLPNANLTADAAKELGRKLDRFAGAIG
jgi:N-acetylneuraminate lyase